MRFRSFGYLVEVFGLWIYGLERVGSKVKV